MGPARSGLRGRAGAAVLLERRTPLSAHELRMDDDVYQSRQDPAVTVGFRGDAPGHDLDGAHLLVWTTAP